MVLLGGQFKSATHGQFKSAQGGHFDRILHLRPDLEKIQIPTLILHGKNDKICSFDLAEQMKAGIKGSHLVTFEKSGHSLFLEETHKFNTELIKFAEK